MMSQTQMFKQAQRRYEQFKMKRKTFDTFGDTWYRMEKTDDAATVYIYDAIGFFGVSAEAFVRDLEEMDVDDMTLRINSPGGDVFDGMAIFNAIKRHPANVLTVVDGLAASMASVIALAGDERQMAEGTFFMIHDPWSLVIGSAEDMRQEAVLLDKIADQAVEIYTSRSNLSEAEVRAAMKAETWFTAKEADEAGFAQLIDDEPERLDRFDLSVFANTPAEIQDVPSDQREADLGRRGLEQVLRDAGLSRAQAKGVLSKGLQALTGAEKTDEGQREADVDLVRRIKQNTALLAR